MAEYAISGDVATLLGDDHTAGDPAALWIESSARILVDSTTGRVGGRLRVTLGDDGTFEQDGLPETVSGATPLYRLVVDSLSLRRSGLRRGITTNWFPLETDRDLTWIIANYVEVTPITTEIATQVAAAAALGATNDSATASFINDSGSDTRTAFDTRAATVADTQIVANADRKTRLIVGSTNSDHSTLSAALAAATAGTEIQLRPGTHTITGANTVPAGVRITSGAARGLGSGVASIEGSYGTTISALTMQAGSSIEGVHIKNTHATGGTSTVPVAVDIRGAGVVVRDCTFSGPFAQAILGYQITDLRILDCTFDTIGRTTGSTPGDGINLYGVNGAIVSGCQFRDLKQNAIYVNASAKNVTITGNTVRGGPEGIQVRVGCSNVSIVGNVFDIKGASGVNSFGIIVQTQCVDTVIANNTFRTTAGTATPIAAITIDDRSHRTIIEGNSISGAGFAKGIVIATTGGGGTESLNCVIVGNVVDSSAGVGIEVGANENNVVVTSNRLINGSNKGLYVQATRATIVGNMVTGNSGFDGITVSGSFCSVSGNVVTHVGAGAGILISGTDNTVTGNMCTANNTYGIHETGNTNVITGNNCGGNSHATTDILSAGAASKVAYNIGRYTPKGAA